MLKFQHRRQEQRWAEVLEAREAALRALKERQARLEAELGSLRLKERSDDEHVMVEVLDVEARMEAAQKLLDTERAAQDQERRELQSLIDAARQASAAEVARWKEEERRWQKKEQQYLLDLQDLQSTAARRQEDTARSDDQARRLADSLKEAKSALEKTLAELLRERRVRQETEEERNKAIKKIGEVEQHFEELSRIWDEERGQWRELWDRERSAWETQRLEFAAWEENLRKEREAWHADMTSKDQAQVKFAEQLTRNLRDTTVTSEKLSAVMTKLSDLEQRPPVLVMNDPYAPPRSGFRRRALPWLLALALLAAAAVPAWRWLSVWTMTPIAVKSFTLDNPTSMASDGTVLWVTDWKGTLSAYDPYDLRSPLRSLHVSISGAYRPAAVAIGREMFYTLDAAQGRIVRHQPGDPSAILYWKPAPGPAPTALAWDGKALWSYDAVNKAVYRHGADEANAKAYVLDADVVPTAMNWLGGRLWLFDSRSRRVMAFDFTNDAFTPGFSFAPGESFIGLAAAGTVPAGSSVRRLPFLDGAAPRAQDLLALAGPTAKRQGFALVRLRCGTRLLTIF
jgi:hypothetical protein